MARQLITEQTIRALLGKGSRTLETSKDAIFTPLASELITANAIKIVEPPTKGDTAGPPTAGRTQSAAGPMAAKSDQVVVFGSDHGGFQFKEFLRKYCESLGYTTADVGTHSEEPCDYPDFAYAAAIMVAEGKAWRGVIVDGAGIGSCVVANKVPGVRAACCHDEFVARNAREHNDTNVLTLGSRTVGSEVCKAIMKTWLETPFGGGRHKSRVDKILDVERRFLR